MIILPLIINRIIIIGIHNNIGDKDGQRTRGLFRNEVITTLTSLLAVSLM